MTVTVVDVAIILGSVALLSAFVSGLFIGARIARSAGDGRTGDRQVTKVEVGELVLQLLREVLTVVRELCSGEAGEPEWSELAATRRTRRRRQPRQGANFESKKKG